MTNSWGIKLGSGGRCVPFCEERGIIGVGWKSVDPMVLATADREGLRAHISKSCAFYKGEARAIGGAVGQLWRFSRECKIGDYVLYYDPPRKRVQVARVTSELKHREFEPDVDIDVWHYREVKLAPTPIAIVDFYGGLKGALLGPRMSFWDLRDRRGIAAQLFAGVKNPTTALAPDPKILETYHALRELLVLRLTQLDAADWERLVADYLRAQGAYVDEEKVGGSQAVIDIEARFERGELGDDIWRVQVKRLKHAVDWELIEKDYVNAGEGVRFAYVSVAGFTPEARARASDEGILLLEAGDFMRFLLSGRLRPELRDRLQLPFGA